MWGAEGRSIGIEETEFTSRSAQCLEAQSRKQYFSEVDLEV